MYLLVIYGMAGKWRQSQFAHWYVATDGFGLVFLEREGIGSGDEDNLARIVTCHDPHMLYSNEWRSHASRILAEVWDQREGIR